jgi:hypothetical protein
VTWNEPKDYREGRRSNEAVRPVQTLPGQLPAVMSRRKNEKYSGLNEGVKAPNSKK